MRAKLNSVLDGFRDKRIMIVGDVMLDRYIWGEVKRISPEAPVQVVNVRREEHIPGGAGNTASNVSALDGRVSILGIIGKDSAGKILNTALKKRNILTEGLFVDEQRPTIQKVRVMGQNQQLLRIDYENLENINERLQKELLDFAEGRIKETDVLVFTDYAKGVFNQSFTRELIKLAKDNQKKIIVDPKPKNAVFYSGVDLITPNNKEACEICGKEEINNEDLVAIGNKIINSLNTNVLITRGEKGMSLFEKKEGAFKLTNIPTKAKEVYDVSGAGDTVVAAMSLAIASGASLKEAAIIANFAAGIVVGKLGVATVTVDELREMLR